jgi:pimeloyl-ACP methyl ester carboxylesterase
MTAPPLVLLHGLTGTPQMWSPVLPALSEHHRVLALTLPGHLGGAPLDGQVSVGALASALEAQLDVHGIERAHIAGNSLGGWLALELARRGRARSVVAFAPSGGWGRTVDLRRSSLLVQSARRIALSAGSGAESLLARPRARRLALRVAMERGDLLAPAEAIAMFDAVRDCTIVNDLIAALRRDGPLREGPQCEVPVRIVWGTRDRTIPFERHGPGVVRAFPGSELVRLPGAGHVPMWDAPADVARLILELSTSTNGGTPMADSTTSVQGIHGRVVVHEWHAAEPRMLVALAHGVSEHAGRYEHVARRLVDELGAIVVAPDHRGHGLSDGETGLVEDVDELAADFAAVVDHAREKYAGLPLAVIGHSLGGLIATRYAQEHGEGIAALVLSGPPIGGNAQFAGLLALDPFPAIPLDPAVLSRDSAVGDAYLADPLVYSGPLDRRTVEAIVVVAVERIAASRKLGPFPTLWLHGELDPLAPLDVSRAAIARVGGGQIEERIYPGAMHEVFNEVNRDEVLGDLVGFLARELG